MIHAVRATGDKAQMKGGEKKQREKGENKIKCSKREIGESGIKREEAQDRLSDKYVRCMLQFTAPPPLAHDHSFWDASKGYCFLLFWLCQENYRHEAPELLAITSYIFFPHACKKTEKKKKGDNSDSEGKIQQSRMR